ncbi:hypothetical protein HDV05_003393 [Chytridiales sp. JEL 0842]|nr:hypothetical protein HDV05_003393 [Chytridiales sp. JEL 0842]
MSPPPPKAFELVTAHLMQDPPSLVQWVIAISKYLSEDNQGNRQTSTTAISNQTNGTATNKGQPATTDQPISIMANGTPKVLPGGNAYFVINELDFFGLPLSISAIFRFLNLPIIRNLVAPTLASLKLRASGPHGLLIPPQLLPALAQTSPPTSLKSLLPNLLRLDVSWTPSINPLDIKMLLAASPSIQQLNIDACPLLGLSTLNDVANICKKLQFFSTTMNEIGLNSFKPDSSSTISDVDIARFVGKVCFANVSLSKVRIPQKLHRLTWEDKTENEKNINPSKPSSQSLFKEFPTINFVFHKALADYIFWKGSDPADTPILLSEEEYRVLNQRSSTIIPRPFGNCTTFYAYCFENNRYPLFMSQFLKTAPDINLGAPLFTFLRQCIAPPTNISNQKNTLKLDKSVKTVIAGILKLGLRLSTPFWITQASANVFIPGGLDFPTERYGNGPNLYIKLTLAHIIVPLFPEMCTKLLFSLHQKSLQQFLNAISPIEYSFATKGKRLTPVEDGVEARINLFGIMLRFDPSGSTLQKLIASDEFRALVHCNNPGDPHQTDTVFASGSTVTCELFSNTILQIVKKEPLKPRTISLLAALAKARMTSVISQVLIGNSTYQTGLIHLIIKDSLDIKLLPFERVLIDMLNLAPWVLLGENVLEWIVKNGAWDFVRMIRQQNIAPFDRKIQSSSLRRCLLMYSLADGLVEFTDLFAEEEDLKSCWEIPTDLLQPLVRSKILKLAFDLNSEHQCSISKASLSLGHLLILGTSNSTLLETFLEDIQPFGNLAIKIADKEVVLDTISFLDIAFLTDNRDAAEYLIKRNWHLTTPLILLTWLNKTLSAYPFPQFDGSEVMDNSNPPEFIRLFVSTLDLRPLLECTDLGNLPSCIIHDFYARTWISSESLLPLLSLPSFEINISDPKIMIPPIICTACYRLDLAVLVPLLPNPVVKLDVRVPGDTMQSCLHLLTYGYQKATDEIRAITLPLICAMLKHASGTGKRAAAYRDSKGRLPRELWEALDGTGKVVDALKAAEEEERQGGYVENIVEMHVEPSKLDGKDNSASHSTLATKLAAASATAQAPATEKRDTSLGKREREYEKESDESKNAQKRKLLGQNGTSAGHTSPGSMLKEAAITLPKRKSTAIEATHSESQQDLRQSLSNTSSPSTSSGDLRQRISSKNGGMQIPPPLVNRLGDNDNKDMRQRIESIREARLAIIPSSKVENLKIEVSEAGIRRVNNASAGSSVVVSSSRSPQPIRRDDQHQAMMAPSDLQIVNFPQLKITVLPTVNLQTLAAIENTSILHLASAAADPYLFKHLFMTRPDLVKKQNKYGLLPLHLLCDSPFVNLNDLAMVEIAENLMHLVQFSPIMFDVRHRTPLSMAIFRDAIRGYNHGSAITISMLRRGATLATTKGDTVSSPLHSLARDAKLNDVTSGVDDGSWVEQEAIKMKQALGLSMQGLLVDTYHWANVIQMQWMNGVAPHGKPSFYGDHLIFFMKGKIERESAAQIIV